MKIAQPGSKVKVHYVCKLENGEVVESTKDSKELIIGRGQALPGLDKGITGMQIGEKRLIKLNPEDAYGYYQKDLVSEVPKESLPQVKDPQKGQRFVLTTQAGKPVHAKLLEILPNSYIVDLNHPLAGQKLIFDVVLMEIVI